MRGWLHAAGACLLAAAIALPPYLLPEYVITSLILVLFNCYLAQCWNLAAGYAGQLALGHTLFLAIGGYTSSVLFARYGVTPWLGLWAGGFIAAGVGGVLSAIAFRYRVKGIFFALITLASAGVARGLFEHWDFIGGTRGIFIPLSPDPSSMTFLTRAPYYVIIATMVVALTAATLYLSRSRFGQYLLALREDEAAAEATGVPTFRCKVYAISLSAFFTALGGTFYAQFLLYLAPETVFNFEHMLGMILGTMLGGAGTVAGPLIGAALLSTLSQVFRLLPIANSYEVASLLKMIYAIVLIVIIVKLPGGLISLVRNRRR
jgi:branched-chain amino acid transport system permease protein